MVTYIFVINQLHIYEKRCLSSYCRSGTYSCPMLACVGSACSEAVIRSHFLCHHPQDLVCCPMEGSLPLPQCDRCGLQISHTALNGCHYETALCRDGMRRSKEGTTCGSQMRISILRSNIHSIRQEFRKGGGL